MSKSPCLNLESSQPTWGITRMSEKMMAASKGNRLSGCEDIKSRETPQGQRQVSAHLFTSVSRCTDDDQHSESEHGRGEDGISSSTEGRCWFEETKGDPCSSDLYLTSPVYTGGYWLSGNWKAGWYLQSELATRLWWATRVEEIPSFSGLAKLWRWNWILCDFLIMTEGNVRVFQRGK